MQPTCNEVNTDFESTEFEEHVVEKPDCSTVGMDSIWYDSLCD